MKKLLILSIVGFYSITVFSQTFKNEWIDHSKTYHKFKVHFGLGANSQPIKNRLVRINQPALVTAGLQNIPAENFKLFRNGTEIPIYTSLASGIFSAIDYIEFWGEINDGKLDGDLYRNSEQQLSDIWSLQEDSASYFITSNIGINKRLNTTANNVAGNSLPPTLYFINSVSFTFRSRLNLGFAAQAAQPLYSSSYDRGEGYTTRPIRPNGSSCGQQSFTLTLTNLKPYLAGPNMTLKINAVGNANNSRTVLVRLNGDTVSNFQMDYFFDAKVEEVGINVNKIASGTAAIQHINQSSIDCDEFRLAKNELIYPRSLDGNNGTSLEIKLPASATGHFLQFYNFNYGTNPPILYDVTNGKRYIGNVSIADTIRFVTSALPTTSTLILVKDTITNALAITNMRARIFTNYSLSQNQGDYLIISNPLIYGSGANNFVEQYRNYRASSNGGGYNTKLIDISEITDQFAYGVNKHPLSIRNFLRYSRANFATIPKFVFLIGKGLNYVDFKSNSGASDINVQNLVPTWGHPASDNLLAATNNLNAVPTTPIGRLSAISATEVGDYLAKVKQYDSLQRSPSNLIADKAWMKNVLQVAGANDYNIGTQLDGFLLRYKAIIQDTSYGALARNYDKLTDPSAYTQSLKEFKNIYETGASIVTYFGHSSATNLDFSLDNPSAYNNQYKYPIFIVNGCDAGNFFTYEPDRLNQRTTISEKFIFEPQRGAIGYLATTGFGVVNYLDSFTRKFYQAIAKTQYNQPFGVIIKDGITNLLSNTGSSDYFARIHSEQFTFHGDPAIKVNTFSKPDYVIEAAQLKVSPSFISVADDSFYVKTKIYNIGKKTADSVNLKITRQFPSGITQTIFTKKFAAIATIDSITIALPIVANRDSGNNIITAIIDDVNLINEISETNNSASITAIVSDAEIKPIYPYKYAIVNNASFKFAASTANPITISKSYIVEVDTTAFFNSPLKYTQTKTSIGGVIEFDNGIALQNNTTYYWRVALQGVNQRWNNSSFTYKTSPNVGFEQRHFYQHTESNFNRIFLDSASRKFAFRNKPNNLFMLHSIYPTSGTEDQQFSIQVNGSGIIASACLGQSVIINVFDTLTLKPWVNTTNPFGAEPTCDVSRKYNFEYHYIDSAARNNAKQFLQSIPNGLLVAVRLVYDGDAVWANEWAADSTVYGANNTLYSFLKQQGLPIDSFYAPRTFGIIFKKNDSTRFSPRHQFSKGLYDRVVMSIDYDAKDTLGYVTSPKFGPSKAWKNVKWNGSGTPRNNVSLDVLGVNNFGVETRLYTLDTLQTNFDISSVSVAQYPFIKLKMKNQDSITAVPYQLSNWSVEYDAAPEGAMAPNLFFNMPDTAGVAFSGNDTLKGGVAFKNVSKVNFDSITVKLVLTNLRLGTITTFNLPKTKALLAGDTVQVKYAINIAAMPQDKYNLYLVVNDNNAQPEQYFFNNFLYKYVYLKTNLILPVTLLNFSAKPVANTVDVSWQVTDEVNLAKYEIEHSSNAVSFIKLGAINAKGGMGNIDYLYKHLSPLIGKNYYRLKMLNADASFTYSPTRLVSFGKGVIVNVYPNPVTDKLNIVVSKQDVKANTLKLLNSFGQQLLTKTFASTTFIDMKGFASGTYILQIDDGSEIKTIKIVKQ